MPRIRIEEFGKTVHSLVKIVGRTQNDMKSRFTVRDIAKMAKNGRLRQRSQNELKQQKVFFNEYFLQLFRIFSENNCFVTSHVYPFLWIFCTC